MSDTSTMIGFVGREADRLPCLLERIGTAPWLVAANGVQPWGTGQYMGAQAIRRMQSGRLRGDLLFRDLLFPEGRSPMVIARALTPGSPPIADEQPFCFGSWLVVLEDPVVGEERASWIAALPPFLRRARRSGGGAELLFLRLIAALHDAHLLDDQEGDEDRAARTLAAVAARAERSTNILAMNGGALFAYRAVTPLSFLTFTGISSCAPCRVGEGFARFPPIIESHRRFRGVCVASEPFAAEERWQEIPEASVLVVDRSTSARIIEV